MGDSITHGYGSGITVPNSYRKTLKNLLDADGYDTDFVGSLTDGDFPDNQHEGHDGWFADHATQTNTVVSHAASWTAASRADVVLLHIGTNDIINDNEDANEVALILDQIFAVNSNATVVLALIINANPVRTAITTYNSNLSVMAQARISNGDDLIIVDMENGAGIDYASADMGTWHPFQAGYDKMGTNWHAATVTAIKRQLLKQQPRIERISITANSLTLELVNLSTGALTSIERSLSLDPAAWTNVTTFTPSTSATNCTQLLGTPETAFFRISTD